MAQVLSSPDKKEKKGNKEYIIIVPAKPNMAEPEEATPKVVEQMEAGPNLVEIKEPRPNLVEETETSV